MSAARVRNLTFSARGEAMACAAGTSRTRTGTWYVVYEGGEYHVASEYDMETFFNGAKPVAAFEGGQWLDDSL